MINRAVIAFAFAIFGIGAIGCAADHSDHSPAAAAADKGNVAICEVHPTTTGKAKGTVTFTQQGDKVKVVAHIEGLKPNSTHGFHIHEGTECGPDGMKAGGHYNPDKHQHAGPDEPSRHAGDLGNLQANDKGVAEKEITVDNISVNGQKNPIVGRTIIVHADPDDYKTQPTGNAGGRIGCGVIRMAGDKKTDDHAGH